MKKALLIFLLLLISFTFAQDFYPTTISNLDSTVIQSGSGTITNLNEGEEVKFKTLTFQESEFQKTTIIKEELYIDGETFYPKHIFDELGNKYVQFSITKNGNFTYELIAKINTTSLIYKIINRTSSIIQTN